MSCQCEAPRGADSADHGLVIVIIVSVVLAAAAVVAVFLPLYIQTRGKSGTPATKDEH